MSTLQPILLTVVLFGIAAPATAQWLTYPSAGIPRTEDGQPDLFAPAPKTLEGKPDLSGIWGGGPRMPFLVPTPLTAKGRTVIENFRASQSNNKNTNRTRCLPHFLNYLLPGTLNKIVQTPTLLVFLYEAQGMPLPRQIFMDGRPLPESPNPSWMGYSVGRWEGNALVIETIGFHDRGVIPTPEGGFPMSETTRITERLERIDFGHMEIKITFDDPEMFTKPWSFNLAQEFRADTEILEWVCENNDSILRHMVDPK